MNAAWVVELNLEKLTIPALSTALELSIRTAHNNVHDEMGCKSLISTRMHFLHVCHNGLNAAIGLGKTLKNKDTSVE